MADTAVPTQADADRELTAKHRARSPSRRATTATAWARCGGWRPHTGRGATASAPWLRSTASRGIAGPDAAAAARAPGLGEFSVSAAARRADRTPVP